LIRCQSMMFYRRANTTEEQRAETAEQGEAQQVRRGLYKATDMP
jgi:hypothetical protein